MSDHDKISGADEYLWDPTRPADGEVARLEALLASARLDSQGLRPLLLTEPRIRHWRWRRWVLGAAAAGLVCAVALGGWLGWRWDWPAGHPWTMTLESVAAAEGPSPRTLPLSVGEPVSVPLSTSARVEIARIGRMSLSAGSELTLLSTASNHHRLVLTRGEVHVRVWAPPWSVVFTTPAGEVGDLGCEFRMRVGAERTTHVQVLTGWVELENTHGETLVPAGASAEMAVDRRPLVPLFDDAPESFKEAVRKLESTSDEAAALMAISVVTEQARPRDAMTLLVLATRIEGARRDRLVEAAARLVPPPPGIGSPPSRGDLWRWYEALPLPPPKSWWRNWPDGLP